MSAEPLTERQRMAISLCQDANLQRADAAVALGRYVKEALELGVPILTLANALGVSRSRIRRLAR